MPSIDSPLVFSRGVNPYNKTWEDWTAKWCKWLLSIPKDNNPSVDDNGENCAENQDDPLVWFLGGTFGNNKVVKRKCIVSSEKAILFPILEKEDSFVEDSDLDTEEELAARAEGAMDKVTILFASVDNEIIDDLKRYRVRSSFFDLNFPENNVYDIPPCTTRSVCDGYWVFIKPLRAGKHCIKFKGECLMEEGDVPTERINTDSVYTQIRKNVQKFHTFKVNVTYELLVQ
jgi:hypothetical protein